MEWAMVRATLRLSAAGGSENGSIFAGRITGMTMRVWYCWGVLFTLWAASLCHGFNAEARNLLLEGYTASLSRDWNGAIARYSEAIDRDPGYTEAYFQRAAAHEMAGNTDSAIADYEKVLSLKPAYYLAMEYLARLYDENGQYTKAVDLYGRALAQVQDPKWRSVLKAWIAHAELKMKPSAAESDGVSPPRTPSGRSPRR
jgi:tetratricopeptide (TPR) repeat protein